MIKLIFFKILWNAFEFKPYVYKRAIRHLSGTNNPQLNAFDYSSSFTFFDGIQKQRLLEIKQPPFRVTKPNNFHYGAFAWITNSQLVLNSSLKEKAVRWIYMNVSLKKIVGL